MVMLDVISSIYNHMPGWAVTPVFVVAVFAVNILRYFDPRPTTRNTFILCILGFFMYIGFDFVDISVRGFFTRVWIMAFVINEAIVKPYAAMKYLYLPAWRAGMYQEAPLWATKTFLLLDAVCSKTYSKLEKWHG